MSVENKRSQSNIEGGIKCHRIGNGLSQMETHDPADNSLFENLVRVEHDLSDVISALALLGVKRCSQ